MAHFTNIHPDPWTKFTHPREAMCTSFGRNALSNTVRMSRLVPLFATLWCKWWVRIWCEYILMRRDHLTGLNKRSVQIWDENWESCTVDYQIGNMNIHDLIEYSPTHQWYATNTKGNVDTSVLTNTAAKNFERVWIRFWVCAYRCFFPPEFIPYNNWSILEENFQCSVNSTQKTHTYCHWRSLVNHRKENRNERD